MDKAANVFAMRGLYEEALRYQEHSLMLRTEAFGPRSLEAAMSLFAMGQLLHLQGRDNEARSYLERALAIREELLGESDPNTQLILENLAALD